MNGTSPAKIMTSPGIPTTTNPFYFEALWADWINKCYVLHKGLRHRLQIAESVVDI